MERLDRPDHPIELLVLGHLVAGPGLHAADVEDVGALRDELVGAPEEGVERERRAAVVERVGRAVEDAHHERAGAEVVHSVTEPVAGGHRGTLRERRSCHSPFSSSTIDSSAPRSAKSTATSVGPRPRATSHSSTRAAEERLRVHQSSRWSGAVASTSG